MKNLANISLAEFHQALLALGLHRDRIKGGHEAWSKAGMTRPIIVQTHVSPIPEHIVRNTPRNIGISKNGFITLLENL